MWSDKRFTATSPVLLKDDSPYRVPFALGLLFSGVVFTLFFVTDGLLVVVFTGALVFVGLALVGFAGALTGVLEGLGF